MGSAPIGHRGALEEQMVESLVETPPSPPPRPTSPFLTLPALTGRRPPGHSHQPWSLLGLASVGAGAAVLH